MRRFALALSLVAPAALAQGPGVAPYHAGVDALEAGDSDEAARLLRAAVEATPEDPDAHYALARAFAAGRPPDERQVARHRDAALRLDPEDVRFLEAKLEALRRVLPENRAFSLSDTRRPALARRILERDPGSALAHEELALRAFGEFGWQRSLAQRAGGWDPASARGNSGAANRALARAAEHLDAALARNPASPRAHRLRLRVHANARDDAALAQAARGFAEARPGDPAAVLALGLAAYRQHDTEAAARLFEAALDALPPHDRAAFASLDRFLDDAERAAYAADSVAFAERFWRARDPRLLSDENERRLAHYARLALADLLFADPVRGTRGWDTPRGEVVVRYGLPDADGSWLANNVIARDFGAYERWAYAPADGDDGFDLLFEDEFRSGDYDFPSSAFGPDEATRARSLFRQQPERFVYRPEGLTSFPASVATFRGEGGTTEVVAPLSIPLADGTLSGAELGIESGLFLLGAGSEVVAEARRPIARLDGAAAHRTEGRLFWTGGLTLAAPPGDYTLAVEFEQARTGAVGVQRLRAVLPDYTGGGLRLSSLLPALLVEEVDGPVGAGRVRRGPFVIQPAPQARFAAGEPVYLYAEVYGLALRDGGTRYAVEAVLKPADEAGALARAARFLLGRRAPEGVSVRFDAAGASPDEGQYVILDTAGQPPGAYVLTLRFTDRHTGATAEAARRLDLD
ncbi:MAG: GWxTD domain-containing protein [Rubricoccaceae bacterium]|nr:GWxTD domain-containing protein [Rubricoccaceae bacterium]